MGRRRLLWVRTGLTADSIDRRIPKHTVRGKKGNVCTLPMSDRMQALVKKWVTSSGERRRNW